MEIVHLYRCYIISEFGEEPKWREACSEQYQDNKLDKVSCENIADIAFRPNGQFIKNPLPMMSAHTLEKLPCLLSMVSVVIFNNA